MPIAALAAAAALIALPPPVRGDFDHDGRPDVAELVPARPGTYDLVIRRGAPGHPVAVIDSLPQAQLANFYFSREPPGRLETACGKGLGDDKAPCPLKAVELRGDTLAFGTQEASMAVAVWTGQGFEVVWISD